jgi:hypothetical protein
MVRMAMTRDARVPEVPSHERDSLPVLLLDLPAGLDFRGDFTVVGVETVHTAS